MNVLMTQKTGECLISGFSPPDNKARPKGLHKVFLHYLKFQTFRVSGLCSGSNPHPRQLVSPCKWVSPEPHTLMQRPRFAAIHNLYQWFLTWGLWSLPAGASFCLPPSVLSPRACLHDGQLSAAELASHSIGMPPQVDPPAPSFQLALTQ